MHVQLLINVSRFLISTIDAWVLLYAHQVPRVIVVVTDVSFLDPFETDSVAHTIVKIFLRLDHLIQVFPSKLCLPRAILFHLRCL